MSGTNVQSSMAVIGPQYCLGYFFHLTIVRKMKKVSSGNFRVKNVGDNLIFKVKGKLLSLHDRRFLLDPAGKPIINFQQKFLTAHKRWVAFRGESRDENDRLFSVKKSSVLQMEKKLDVFLASNTAEEVCDFRIEGCFIYSGNSNNVIAQMHEVKSVMSVVCGKHKFGVTVYPNVDYAFIVALVVLLAEIYPIRIFLRNFLEKVVIHGVIQTAHAVVF